MEVICQVADALLCGATFSLTETIQSLSSKVKGLERDYIAHESPEFGLLIFELQVQTFKDNFSWMFSGKSYSVIFSLLVFYDYRHKDRFT